MVYKQDQLHLDSEFDLHEVSHNLSLVPRLSYAKNRYIASHVGQLEGRLLVLIMTSRDEWKKLITDIRVSSPKSEFYR